MNLIDFPDTHQVFRSPDDVQNEPDWFSWHSSGFTLSWWCSEWTWLIFLTLVRICAHLMMFRMNLTDYPEDAQDVHDYACVQVCPDVYPDDLQNINCRDSNPGLSGQLSCAIWFVIPLMWCHCCVAPIYKHHSIDRNAVVKREKYLTLSKHCHNVHHSQESRALLLRQDALERCHPFAR
jgi:hypothetical protein